LKPFFSASFLSILQPYHLLFLLLRKRGIERDSRKPDVFHFSDSSVSLLFLFTSTLLAIPDFHILLVLFKVDFVGQFVLGLVEPWILLRNLADDSSEIVWI